MENTARKRNTTAIPIETKIESYMNELPPYVSEYCSYYFRKRSKNTIVQYLADIKGFFQYLCNENLGVCEGPKDICLETLENLRRQDVETYFNHLRYKGLKEVSINKRIAALKSLFKFLTEITEDDEGEPYFNRNVMKKIAMTQEKNSLQIRASAINSKILHGDEDIQFLHFVAHDYELKIKDNKKKHTRFMQNKERDLAILSLFLGSGLRVSELASLTVGDINSKHQSVDVIRKGLDQKVSVLISSTALDDVQSYLKIRQKRYNIPAHIQDLWVTSNKKGNVKYSSLSVRAIQQLVKKYTQEFGLSNGVTPHKLRHTVGTKVFVRSGYNMIAVKEQLGHMSTQTSELYTHLHNEKLQAIMDDINIKNETDE